MASKNISDVEGDYEAYRGSVHENGGSMREVSAKEADYIDDVFAKEAL